jgi:hypothetical protein
MSKSDAFFSPDQYATVAERIELFYSRFPEGRINTELVTRDGGEITFKALVYRSAAETLAAATGWASEREGDGDINTVACLENTETSAVGRALANLGFTASTRRPSLEEMEKAVRVRRALSLRDAKRKESTNSQAEGDVIDDVLELLAKAETKGLPHKRADILRLRVRARVGLPPARLLKIETALRTWMRRREM